MADEHYDVHLEGDPETESTRRHMERVLRGEPRRRWPWLIGLLAGGTALVFWRARRRASPNAERGTRNAELSLNAEFGTRK